MKHKKQSSFEVACSWLDHVQDIVSTSFFTMRRESRGRLVIEAKPDKIKKSNKREGEKNK